MQISSELELIEEQIKEFEIQKKVYENQKKMNIQDLSIQYSNNSNS